MLYCVVVKREIEEPCTLHYEFNHDPTREEILQKVMDEDFGYDDKYGKMDYWEVIPESQTERLKRRIKNDRTHTINTV